MSDLFLKHVDLNADQVMQYLLQNISVITEDVIINIFSRDTFGVKEIDIFRFVDEWTQTHGLNSDVIQTIRFSLINRIDLKYGLKSSLIFTDSAVINALKHINTRFDSSRICFQPNIILTANNCDFDQIDVPVNRFPIDRLKARRITFRLSVPTKVNTIRFKLNYFPNKSYYPILYYYCEVCVNNRWIEVFDCSQFSTFSTQEIYFDEQTVSSIRIIGVNEGLDDFNLHFHENNLLYYGYIENCIKYDINSIYPKRDHLWKSDSICLIHFKDVCLTYDFTDSVLKNNSFSDFKINFNNCKKFGFNTIYLIRLTQPIYANCLEIEFNLDQNESLNYSIFSLNSLQNIQPFKWQKIFNDLYFKSKRLRISFDLKQMIAIRISGLRIIDDFIKLPLHIKSLNLYYNTKFV